MRWKALLIFGICSLLTAGLTGCETTGISGLLPTGKQEPKIIAASLSDMPEDAAQVVTAAGAIMTGLRTPSPVRFAEPAASALARAGVTEPGFRVRSAALFQYDNTADGSGRQITARIGFQDGLGRRSTCNLMAEYQVSGNNIEVSAASADPVFDTVPETICFVLPAKHLPLSKENRPKTFHKLYQFAAERAILPEDAGNADTEKDWAMMVFFMDRISPSAKMKLGISVTSSGLGGYTKDSRYLDYNGWRVGVAAGRFLLMDPGAEEDLYLKAIYTPGKEAGFFKTPKLVGLYSLRE